MSLIKELWLAILLVVGIAIAGSVSIYGITTRQYVEEQLFAKNIDNANMLALTLSNLEKSPVTIDLFILSQFDIGHYASITLTNIQGEVISEHRINTDHLDAAPNWFTYYFRPEVAPGIAQVNDGWSQYGELRVETDVSFALNSMWHATLRLILGLLIVGVVAGTLGACAFLVNPPLWPSRLDGASVVQGKPSQAPVVQLC